MGLKVYKPAASDRELGPWPARSIGEFFSARNQSLVRVSMVSRDDGPGRLTRCRKQFGVVVGVTVVLTFLVYCGQIYAVSQGVSGPRESMVRVTGANLGDRAGPGKETSNSGADADASAAGTPPPDSNEPGLAYAKPNSLFCYAVLMNPPEPTFPQVLEAVRQCDGFMFFSNFADDEKHVEALIKGDMKVPYGGLWGSALNTPHFHKVWKRMASDPFISRFGWFAKIDLDTLFFPKNLRRFISEVQTQEPGESVAWGAPIPGPIEVFNRAALEDFGRRHSTVCDDNLRLDSEWRQEDMYIFKCLEALGYRNLEPARMWRFDGYIPDVALARMAEGEPRVCYAPNPGEEERCLERDEMRKLVVFHPLKSPKHMNVLRGWLGL